MVIRPEEPCDRRAIHALEAAAFPTPAEAQLMDALHRAGARPLVSLVADETFMALELIAGALANVAGTVRYHPAFAAVA
jgi:predicted N-acetyltransferase YhbS